MFAVFAIPHPSKVGKVTPVLVNLAHVVTVAPAPHLPSENSTRSVLTFPSGETLVVHQEWGVIVGLIDDRSLVVDCSNGAFRPLSDEVRKAEVLPEPALTPGDSRPV